MTNQSLLSITYITVCNQITNLLVYLTWLTYVHLGCIVYTVLL